MARLTDEQRLLRTVSERAWEAQVEQTLALAEFALIYHTHDSRRSRAGFPDIVAIRADHARRLYTLVVVELKRETETPTFEQLRWLVTWLGIAGAINGTKCGVRIVTGVWKPSDAERIWELLQRGEE
jgi:hypothetical protein